MTASTSSPPDVQSEDAITSPTEPVAQKPEPDAQVDAQPLDRSNVAEHAEPVSGVEASAPVAGVSSEQKAAPAAETAGKDVLPASVKLTEKSTEKEKVEEGASPSPTLTSDHRRQAQMSSTTETAAASQETPKTKPSRSKPSFFSRLVRILLPCVPSSPHSQPIEIDEPKTAPVSTTEKPKASKEALEGTTSAAEPSPSKTPAASANNAPLPLSIPPVPVTPTTPDGDLILPPTPTNQLLPQAETEGMTSGAVVPPGSSGTIDSKRSSHYSTSKTNGAADGEDSEGTSSFTDDDEIEDVNNMDDIEDEEDRLISQGGAGIPIGPVRVPTHPQTTLVCSCCNI